MNTLLLDTVAWDLVLDSNGNIALASPPYAVAQDVSSAIRTFLGEVWYDTNLGVPYWQELLGNPFISSVASSAISAAVLQVPGVANASVVVSSVTDRTVSGQVQFTTTSGETGTVNF